MIEQTVTTAAIDPEGAVQFQKLRHELGVESFGINLVRLRPGQRGRIHTHSRQEEVYLVIDGELTLYVEGESFGLPTGHLARVGPSIKRQIANATARPTTILALGAYGEHEGRDGLAWIDWDEEGKGRPPSEVPLPKDLPIPSGSDPQ